MKILPRRKTLDERLVRVMVRALEREYPQRWTSLHEASIPEPKPRDLHLTSWDISYIHNMVSQRPELTITIGATGWP